MTLQLQNIPKVGELLTSKADAERLDYKSFSLLVLSAPKLHDNCWRMWVLRIGGVGPEVYEGTFETFDYFERTLAED